MIMGIEGGMRMAADAAFDTMAALSARGYPRFSMAGITTLPMAAASATDEPEISLWIRVATTVTMASPPRMNPTRLFARLTSRWEMPEVSMRPPARMNSGMASSGKLEAPPNRFNGTTLSEAAPVHRMARIVAIESAYPIGSLIAVRPTITPRMIHSTCRGLPAYTLDPSTAQSAAQGSGP